MNPDTPQRMDKAATCAHLLHPQYSDEWWQTIASKQPEPGLSKSRKQWQDAHKMRDYIANLIRSVYEPETLKMSLKEFSEIVDWDEKYEETKRVIDTISDNCKES
jgi:hypothetical protein